MPESVLEQETDKLHFTPISVKTCYPLVIHWIFGQLQANNKENSCLQPVVDTISKTTKI